MGFKLTKGKKMINEKKRRTRWRDAQTAVTKIILMVLTKCILPSSLCKKPKKVNGSKRRGFEEGAVPDEASCIKPSLLDLSQSPAAALNLGVLSSLLVFKSFYRRSGREIRTSG